MISKNMNKLLKHIPHSPERITLRELYKKKLFDADLQSNLMEEARECHYIICASHKPHKDYLETTYCLTEAGQIELEEFKGHKSASAKATWALIISGLSFAASVVAIIVSCVVQ